MTRRFFSLLLALTVLFSPLRAVRAAGVGGVPVEGPTTVTYPAPADLTALVNTVCDGARARFHGFFGPRVIWIKPFTTLGREERSRPTELAATLADQMTAVINNDTLTTRGKASGQTTQGLTGVIQELDGYLRIHLSGVNAAGERASYVVNVEMSEPIYRALHTYL